MTWIHCRSGVRFDLIAPTTDMVRREDIEHALARVNRFSGHTAEPYSVATHSLLVADILALWGCPPAIVREGLLHDAPETYYGDLTSPLKSALRARSMSDEGVCLDFAARVTRDIDLIVRAALSLPEHETAIVKHADLVALAIERRDLFGQPEHDWSLPEYADTRLRAEPEWHRDAQKRFEARWRELDEACGVSR